MIATGNAKDTILAGGETALLLAAGLLAPQKRGGT